METDQKNTHLKSSTALILLASLGLCILGSNPSNIAFAQSTSPTTATNKQSMPTKDPTCNLDKNDENCETENAFHKLMQSIINQFHQFTNSNTSQSTAITGNAGGANGSGAGNTTVTGAPITPNTLPGGAAGNGGAGNVFITGTPGTTGGLILGAAGNGGVGNAGGATGNGGAGNGGGAAGNVGGAAGNVGGAVLLTPGTLLGGAADNGGVGNVGGAAGNGGAGNVGGAAGNSGVGNVGGAAGNGGAGNVGGAAGNGGAGNVGGAAGNGGVGNVGGAAGNGGAGNVGGGAGNVDGAAGNGSVGNVGGAAGNGGAGSNPSNTPGVIESNPYATNSVTNTTTANSPSTTTGGTTDKNTHTTITAPLISNSITATDMTSSFQQPQTVGTTVDPNVQAFANSQFAHSQSFSPVTVTSQSSTTQSSNILTPVVRPFSLTDDQSKTSQTSSSQSKDNTTQTQTGQTTDSSTSNGQLLVQPNYDTSVTVTTTSTYEQPQTSGSTQQTQKTSVLSTALVTPTYGTGKFTNGQALYDSNQKLLGLINYQNLTATGDMKTYNGYLYNDKGGVVGAFVNGKYYTFNGTQWMQCSQGAGMTIIYTPIKQDPVAALNTPKTTTTATTTSTTNTVTTTRAKSTPPSPTQDITYIDEDSGTKEDRNSTRDQGRPSLISVVRSF